MRLTKPILIVFLCAAIATGLYFLFARPESTPTQTNSSDAASASQDSATTPQSASKSDPPPPVTPAPTAPGAGPPFSPSAPLPPATPFLLGSADTPPAMEPATVLSNMRIVINRYGSQYGGNPVGRNPEITAALNGGNPNGAKFITEDSGLRINGQGELVDYWGTPFFFHQLSGAEMETRSAGPDKKMWTADDLVTK